VNASPGFQGVEAFTKENVAEHIIKFLETNVRKKIRNEPIEIRGHRVA